VRNHLTELLLAFRAGIIKYRSSEASGPNEDGRRRHKSSAF
jgi:hypothetical protein